MCALAKWACFHFFDFHPALLLKKPAHPLSRCTPSAFDGTAGKDGSKLRSPSLDWHHTKRATGGFSLDHRVACAGHPLVQVSHSPLGRAASGVMQRFPKSMMLSRDGLIGSPGCRLRNHTNRRSLYDDTSATQMSQMPWSMTLSVLSWCSKDSEKPSNTSPRSICPLASAAVQPATPAASPARSRAL